MNDEQGEDLDLTPDMTKTWGKVIRGLRESGEHMLTAVCAELNTVDYTNDTIEVNCKDESTYNLLVKHKDKLEKFAGLGCVNVHRQVTQKSNQELITGLTNIFGDKLTVKKR